MDRRELFKIIAAGAIAGPLAAQTHTHAHAHAAASGIKLKPFFTQDQSAVLDRLSDIIIPTDELSPGAHDAGVVHYLDLLAAAESPARRRLWLRGLNAVEATARARYSRGFMECAREQQEELMAQMAAHEGAPQNDLENFFELLKPAVIDGYRYSEIGVKEYMRWVGNQFDTKTWAGACHHPEHGVKV